MATGKIHPIWELEELEQAEYIESMLDPFKEEVQRQYQEGPYRLWAKECWQVRSLVPWPDDEETCRPLGRIQADAR